MRSFIKNVEILFCYEMSHPFTDDHLLLPLLCAAVCELYQPDSSRFMSYYNEALQVHDIADMLKQYFRELPEPLMTMEYSEVFTNIYLCKCSTFKM